MPKSNSRLLSFLTFFCILHYSPELVGQVEGAELLQKIEQNINSDEPQNNDVFIAQYKAKKMEALDCAVKGRILHQLGLGLYYQNREKEAIALFEDAIHKVWVGCAEIGNTERANTSFNIGVCYQYTSEAISGRKYIEQAMATFTADKNYPKADLCYKYQGAGNFFSTVKDFTKAALYYKAAENLAAYVPTSDQFHLYNEFFVLYLSFGEWEAARNKAEFLTRFAYQNRKEVDDLSLAILHLNKAEMWIKTGDLSKVPEECALALKLLPKEDIEFRSNAHEILGVYYLEVKDYPKSRDHYQQAYQLRSAVQNIVQANLARAFSIENLAEIAFQTGDYHQALRQINEAIGLLASPCSIDNDGDPVLQNCLSANGIHLMRQLLLKQKIRTRIKENDLTQLLKNQKISYKLDSLSSMVLQQAYVDESKLYVLSQLSDKTEAQVNTAIGLYQQTGEQQYLVTAADFVSGSKSLILKQFLDQNKLLNLKKGSKNYDAVLALREKLTRLRNELETTGSSHDSLFAKTNHLMAELELAEAKTGLTGSTTRVKNEAISHTLPKLPRDVMVIESFTGKETIHFFIYTRTGIQHTSHDRKEIQGLVSKVKVSLESPDKAYDKISAAKLWSRCFGSMLKDQRFRKLVFIPDVVFHGLPLEALVDEKGRYIVENLTIQYSNSAQMLMPQKEDRDFKHEFTGFATSYGSGLNDRLGRISHFKGLALQPLYNAVKELEASGKAFTTRIFTHQAANPVAFKTNGPDSRILYFSLHSVANENNGSLSALIFDEKNPEFILHSYEINALPLNAELVVLSSCQSASGKIFTGEGIQGLTRSFLLAGCQQVVSSIWNASEESAGKILPYFMEMVANHEDPAEALTQAKQKFLSSSSPSQKHPYYWAGFVLTGSLAAPTSHQYLWILAPSLLILGLLGFVWNKKVKKNTETTGS